VACRETLARQESQSVRNMRQLRSARVTSGEAKQIAAAQLAVQCQVAEGQIAVLVRELQPDSNRPDLLRLQRRLLPEQASPVPLCSIGADVSPFGKALTLVSC
jgi:hypothetical protein